MSCGASQMTEINARCLETLSILRESTTVTNKTEGPIRDVFWRPVEVLGCFSVGCLYDHSRRNVVAHSSGYVATASSEKYQYFKQTAESPC